ncbi:hypothetical protein [Streptacidiphilus carbonis]|uniref:hypothetical protein n=1 Tax=Streptacidiphilus carbonis TaxID=105422 RepID=UPI000694FE69|nr:hypothetical protein [Streptacidiphilus carbonis]
MIRAEELKANWDQDRRCPVVHRRRLEGRSRGIEGFAEPTWEDVALQQKEFAPWSDRRLVLDAMVDLPSNLARAVDFLTAAS